MRELEQLLIDWFERHYPVASPSRKCAFRRLLELQDPELAGYLLWGSEPTDPQLADVVDCIRMRSASR